MGLRLVKHNPATGEVEYRGTVALSEMRSLTFTIVGNAGPANNPFVQLKFDAYEAPTIEAAIARMGDWMEAAARCCRGVPTRGVPAEFVIAPTVDEGGA